ncbi:MAG: cytochrome c [Mucilaginibacter sp.]|nr:cytochrome c [Mucilaginibacter sp.]
MKRFSIKGNTLMLVVILSGLASILIMSCAENAKIAAKSGAQLWAENCQRCHNTPSPASFSHEQWQIIGLHMQTRAQLTDKEKDKIIAFLSQ